MANKIYRTIIRYEILTEERFEDGMTLSDIHELCTEGHGSGVFLYDEIRNEQLIGKEAVKAIKAQGSDPEFFLMDDDGNDISENI